jgi:hypothetical protein
METSCESGAVGSEVGRDGWPIDLADLGST